MSRLTSTTVYLSSDALSRLKAISARSGVPMAKLFREGLDMVLAAHESRVEGSSPEAEIAAGTGADPFEALP